MKKFILGFLILFSLSASAQFSKGLLVKQDTGLYHASSDLYQIVVGTDLKPYYWDGAKYRGFSLTTPASSSSNTFLGWQSLNAFTTGTFNTSLGYRALKVITTGTHNTALGDSAGYTLVSGKGNIFLGAKAGGAETGDSTLYIDNSNTSSPLIKGDMTAAVKKVTINGSLAVTGKTYITAGSNKSVGTATLVAGTVTVSNTSVTTSSIIFVSRNTAGGTLGVGFAVPVASIVNGTSFVINAVATNGTVSTADVSTVNWWIVN